MKTVLCILPSSSDAANSVIYRVMERYDVCGSKGEYTVKFEGGIAELTSTFPRSNIKSLDVLATGFECEAFVSHIHFERKEGEEWVVCDDPRTEVYDDRFYRWKRNY